MATRLQLDRRAIAGIASDDEGRRATVAATEPVVTDARRFAPKRTGAGAASIHAEYGKDGRGWRGDVSWDAQHFYMQFQELGTRRQRARPFLRPALRMHALR